jgi:DNA-binding NarL/FixJ family response regulator
MGFTAMLFPTMGAEWQLRQNLIVLDVGLRGLSGIEVARRIRALSPNSRILFLTDNYCQEIAEEALRTGGNGYVVRSQAAHELLVPVETVLQDKAVCQFEFDEA